MGGIIHVVQLQFKPEVDARQVNDVLSHMRALRDKCVKPDTQSPYIKSVTVGADNSSEGHQNGFTHMMVTIFETVGDRNYYATLDPAHMAILERVGPFTKNLQVLDINA